MRCSTAALLAWTLALVAQVKAFECRSVDCRGPRLRWDAHKRSLLQAQETPNSADVSFSWTTQNDCENSFRNVERREADRVS